MCFTSLPSQSTLPWADCPLNSNRTGPLEECETATSTKYFFYRETLNISSSIEENGGIQWRQALCLLLAWAITYLFISKGIKSTGKVRELSISMLWNIIIVIVIIIIMVFSFSTFTVDLGEYQ